MAGQRLDRAAATLLSEYSRERIKQWIHAGELTLNGLSKKPTSKVAGGERLAVKTEIVSQTTFEPEPMPLDIIYEDESILVLNKPAGLVVHPAAGNWQGTLLNGLLAYNDVFNRVPRAGIVHRLDKDTSGLMVVAKTIEAQVNLVGQLQARSVKRHYKALVYGVTPESGRIEADIGRHPTQRIKMAVVTHNGKPAITHYKRVACHDELSLMDVHLETGRTHQIRVHFSSLGHGLVGDPVYTWDRGKTRLAEKTVLAQCAKFSRQALHAFQLGLVHPQTQAYCQWQAPLPEDFNALILSLGLANG